MKTLNLHTLGHFPGDDCDHSHDAGDQNCVERYLFVSFLRYTSADMNLQSIFLSKRALWVYSMTVTKERISEHITGKYL
jgi:hypothetical protein